MVLEVAALKQVAYERGRIRMGALQWFQRRIGRVWWWRAKGQLPDKSHYCRRDGDAHTTQQATNKIISNWKQNYFHQLGKF